MLAPLAVLRGLCAVPGGPGPAGCEEGGDDDGVDALEGGSGTWEGDGDGGGDAAAAAAGRRRHHHHLPGVPGCTWWVGCEVWGPTSASITGTECDGAQAPGKPCPRRKLKTPSFLK